MHVRRSIAEEASVSAHISGFGATKPQVSQLRTLKISDLEPSQVFRRSRAIAKRGIDAADLRTRLAKVERSLELAYLDRRQADVDAIESEAVRRLVDSLKDVPHACVRIGSIFLIKYEEVRGPYWSFVLYPRLRYMRWSGFPRSRETLGRRWRHSPRLSFLFSRSAPRRSR